MCFYVALWFCSELKRGKEFVGSWWTFSKQSAYVVLNVLDSLFYSIKLCFKIWILL